MADLLGHGRLERIPGGRREDKAAKARRLSPLSPEGRGEQEGEARRKVASGKFSPSRGRSVTVAAGTDPPWGRERGGHAIPCPCLLCRATRLCRGEGARVRAEGGRAQGQRLAALPRADRRQRLPGA